MCSGGNECFWADSGSAGGLDRCAGWVNLRETRLLDGFGLRFSVIVERDRDGVYVGSVSGLPGCHTQAGTVDELMERMREAVELYLEAA